MSQGPANYAKDRIVRFPFRIVLDFDTPWSTSRGMGTFAELDVVPQQFGNRVGAMALMFDHYRFTKLKIRMLAGDGSADANYANVITCLAYQPVPSSTTGAISSVAGASELAFFDMSNGMARTTELVLSKRDLLSPTLPKWFDTQATGSPDDNERYQGTLYFTAYSFNQPQVQQTIYLCIEGVMEVCGAVDPADSMTRLLKDPAFAAKLGNLNGQPDLSDEKSDNDGVVVPSPALSRKSTNAGIPRAPAKSSGGKGKDQRS